MSLSGTYAEYRLPHLQAAWRRHEYVVIATSSLTMELAATALQQQATLLARNKQKVYFASK